MNERVKGVPFELNVLCNERFRSFTDNDALADLSGEKYQ
jgi:hypothetical protein